MFVVIAGAGRVGSAVARTALESGHEVSVLDEDPLSHERLDAGQPTSWEDAGGRFTVGTAIEIEALVEAGIESRPTSSSPPPTATTRTSSSPRSPRSTSRCLA